MNTVVNFLQFRERARELPALVLIDLHEELSAGVQPAGPPPFSEALANCRAALRHARACSIPVAFTRRVSPPQSMLATPVYPKWIEGFEPNRYDMVFDRQLPSCYASSEFRAYAAEIGGNYVVAGQFAQLACLSTVVDAFHRDHRPAFLADALVCRAEGDVSDTATLRAVAGILSHYAEPTGTQPWIRATSRRVGAIR